MLRKKDFKQFTRNRKTEFMRNETLKLTRD